MAQPMVSNMNMNGLNSSEAKDQPDQNCDNRNGPQQQQQSQPTVRHIPIFVEGRDQPLLNKNVERSPSDGTSGQRQPSPTFSDLSKSGSIFDRVKDIPVRRIIPEFQSPNAGRTASPNRTIPINVAHETSQKDIHGAASAGHHPQQQRQYQRQTHQEQPYVQTSNSKSHSIPIKVEHSNSQKDTSKQTPQQTPRGQTASQQPNAADEVDSAATKKPSPAVQQSLDAIAKIQKIQNDVLELMNRVEQFKGGSRTDKEYLYLDEMLTQNLLKLDTIDAEGKDNIKAARKEAIKCINKCISVLEAKTDLAASNSSSSDAVGTTQSNDSQPQSQKDHQEQQKGSK